MTVADDLRALIEPVARRLLGEPNRKLSSKTELRFGSRGSMSVDLAKGTFFDHEIGEGGGVLDLVARETGLHGEACFQWLVEEHLLPNGDGRPRQADAGPGRIVAGYRYQDEAGQLLFEVVRFEPKDFRQRRPDASKPSGWNWSTRGVRPVPYRLPELIEALGLGKAVFIVEGEKDVDRLLTLGVPATTNAGGAGKWRSELTEFFAGADVVIIPDNDPQKTHPKTHAPMFHPDGRPVLPGQDHAEAVAHALSAVARVRLLDLAAVWPAMPAKGDVCNWLDSGGGTAEALYELAERLPAWSADDAAEPPAPDAPIEISVGGTERAVNEIERRLIASNRGLYQRGGVIVCTGFAKMPTYGGEVVTQIIAKRGDYALLEDAETVAKFVRFNAKGEPRPCAPPMSLILTLKDREHRLRFPVLTAIVNCPSISADGEMLDRPGYDPRTGVLFDPLGVTFPRVPDFPSEQQARAALKRLLRLIETFKFVSDDDRAVALSLFITIVARRGLPFAPLHGFDAPVAGSGKSKIVDIASILATGHEAGVVSLAKGEEETHKKLSSMIMRGDPLIAIDNCDRPLEGALLNQMLTQTQVELRVLGFSRMVTARTSGLVTATGNNLVLLGDVTRRGVVARLDPKVECPELLSFDYDPIADAKQNRGELVVAALTILRAYHNAGRPDRPSPLQSFTQWSDTVRGALLWLGQGDPVATMRRMRSTDPTLVNLRAFLTAWRAQFPDEPASSAAAIARANEIHISPVTGRPDEHIRRLAHPSFHAALVQVAGRSGKIEVRTLGKYLGQSADRVVDIGADGEPDLVTLEAGSMLDGNRRWRVVSKDGAQA
jgi:putative DNA primase/helicase